jgi:hypothetical protein
MFRKNSVIEINDRFLIKYEGARKKFRVIYKSDSYRFEDLKDIYVDLKYKRAAVILEGEEITVKLLTFPKVKKEALNGLIKNELFYYFKDIDNIVFKYSIINEYNNKLDIHVYCIDKRKINLIENCLNSSTRIKGIYLIQFCIINYFRSKIKEKDYVFAFQYKDNLYFLYCINNKVLHSSVNKTTINEIQFEALLYNFIENCKILYEKDVYKIYYSDCENSRILQDSLRNINCENLGSIDSNKLVSKLAGRGR